MSKKQYIIAAGARSDSLPLVLAGFPSYMVYVDHPVLSSWGGFCFCAIGLLMYNNRDRSFLLRDHLPAITLNRWYALSLSFDLDRQSFPHQQSSPWSLYLCVISPPSLAPPSPQHPTAEFSVLCCLNVRTTFTFLVGLPGFLLGRCRYPQPFHIARPNRLDGPFGVEDTLREAGIGPPAVLPP